MKNTPCSLIVRLKIIKMAIPSKLYRFNIIPNRISADLFVEIEKLILNFMCNCTGLE